MAYHKKGVLKLAPHKRLYAYLLREISRNVQLFHRPIYALRTAALATTVLELFPWRMPGQRCCVCGNSRTKDPQVVFHRYPSAAKNPERRALWLSVFGHTG